MRSTILVVAGECFIAGDHYTCNRHADPTGDKKAIGPRTDKDDTKLLTPRTRVNLSFNMYPSRWAQKMCSMRSSFIIIMERQLTYNVIFLLVYNIINSSRMEIVTAILRSFSHYLLTIFVPLSTLFYVVSGEDTAVNKTSKNLSAHGRLREIKIN